MKDWEEKAEEAELQRKVNNSLKGEPVVHLCTYIGVVHILLWCTFERLAMEKTRKDKEA